MALTENVSITIDHLLTHTSGIPGFDNVKEYESNKKGIVAALRTPIGTIIGHTGGIRGFGASLFYHPEKNIFVCVMMNDDVKAIDPAMFNLMETMMEM